MLLLNTRDTLISRRTVGQAVQLLHYKTQCENITLIEKTHSNVIHSFQTVRWCFLTQNTGASPLMYCLERTFINMYFGLVIILANSKAHPLIPVLTMTSSMNLNKLLNCPELLLFTVGIMSQKDVTLLGTSCLLEVVCGKLLNRGKEQGPFLSKKI